LQKDWLIHTAHEPAIYGRTVRADHNEGRMFCRTLLPAEAKLTAVGGPGKEFWAAGKNWAIEKGRLNAEQLAMMGQWRVEVTPSVAQRADVFLHVIQVGDQRMATMDETSVIHTETRCGVRLVDGGLIWEVTFDKEGHLGGHIRRAGGTRPIDVELTTVVQPQSGIMAGLE
jgi:heparin/heparan-sulfate lyase